MQRVFAVLGRLVRREEGQDLLEYGLVATLIAIAAMYAVGALGNIINTVWWQYIAQSL